MNPVARWSELWLLLDRHFPGDRCEARSVKIDDLYDALYVEHIEPLEDAASALEGWL